MITNGNVNLDVTQASPFNFRTKLFNKEKLNFSAQKEFTLTFLIYLIYTFIGEYIWALSHATPVVLKYKWGIKKGSTLMFKN